MRACADATRTALSTPPWSIRYISYIAWGGPTKLEFTSVLVRRTSFLAVLALLIAGFVAPASAVQVRTPILSIMPLGDSITLGSTGVAHQVGVANHTPG